MPVAEAAGRPRPDPGRPSFPLFIPADRPDLFADACGAGSDAVVIDLEDSVAPDSKVAVRRIPERALPAERAVRLCLRVNGAGTPWYRDDVAFARLAGVDAVYLPKAESAEDVRLLRAALDPGCEVIAFIETVRGLSRVEEIAAAADRLAFGSLDLCEDLGCAHTRLALLPLRSRLVQAARLAGRPAPLDGPAVTVEDEALVAAEARHAAELGFGGKCLIHPRQVAPARAGFSTEPEDLDWARNVRVADGLAVDMPADATGGDEVTARSPVTERARRLRDRRRDWMWDGGAGDPEAAAPGQGAADPAAPGSKVRTHDGSS